MKNQRIRIATRKSPLALWQAEFVQAELMSRWPGLTVELVPMSTRGDKILDAPLAKVGGKGLFVKELESAILEERADIAVHSMKDVPMEFPEGLGLGAICVREDPRDALVSNHYGSLDELPAGAVIGTSSLRRRCQLLNRRPDLRIKDLRGNVNSRLAKLDAGEYDALMLASAGLIRLQMGDRIRQAIAAELSLPAGGQGAVGIEMRIDDTATRDLIAGLHHPLTAQCVEAERSMNATLQGGCQVPIACYAIHDRGKLWLRGLVASLDGRTLLFAEQKSAPAEAVALGRRVAENLLGQGAAEILQQVYGQHG